MALKEFKISRIGNSKGIRLPAKLIRRYRIGDVVLVEENADSITLRAKPGRKLSWKETAISMGKAREDWAAWEITASDGLDEI